MEPTEGATTAATTMPPLEDAESLEGAVVPSPDIYNPAGNKGMAVKKLLPPLRANQNPRLRQ